MTFKKNILRNDVNSIIEFIETVENEHSEKISSMIKNDVEMFFDIDRTLLKIKKYESGSAEEISDVRSLILELHQKLLLIEKHNLINLKVIDEITEDNKLMYDILDENKEALKEVD